MTYGIEVKVFRNVRKYRPTFNGIVGHWTTDLAAAQREGASMQSAHRMLANVD